MWFRPLLIISPDVGLPQPACALCAAEMPLLKLTADRRSHMQEAPDGTTGREVLSVDTVPSEDGCTRSELR